MLLSKLSRRSNVTRRNRSQMGFRTELLESRCMFSANPLLSADEAVNEDSFFDVFIDIDSEERRAAFVKYDGVDGEAQDDNHQDWINLLSTSLASCLRVVVNAEIEDVASSGDRQVVDQAEALVAVLAEDPYDSFAYGTLKFGVSINDGVAGSLDPHAADAATGPGPGAVFGPHVRGWNFVAEDGPMPQFENGDFFAYATLKFPASTFAGDGSNDCHALNVVALVPSVNNILVADLNSDGCGMSQPVDPSPS